MTDKPAALDEKAFNIKFAEALRSVTDWVDDVQAEMRNLFQNSKEVPDLFLSKQGFPPVVFECKYESSLGDPVKDASKKLGLKCAASAGVSSGSEVDFAVAVRHPKGADTWPGSEVDERLAESSDIQWRFVRPDGTGGVDVWPKKGWLEGGVSDLAESVSRTVASAEQISELSEATFDVIDAAASALDGVLENHPEEVVRVAELMGIPEDIAKPKKTGQGKTESENG